jgi:hypothetical protein
MASSSIPIRQETAIAFCINATLSLVFFYAVFGFSSRALSWGEPDALGLDFVPQTIAVSLMSALVPSLLARKRFALSVTKATIFRRAILCGVLGGLLGAMLALVTTQGSLPAIGGYEALALKIVYGGSLGALVTGLTLQRLNR